MSSCHSLCVFHVIFVMKIYFLKWFNQYTSTMRSMAGYWIISYLCFSFLSVNSYEKLDNFLFVVNCSTHVQNVFCFAKKCENFNLRIKHIMANLLYFKYTQKTFNFAQNCFSNVSLHLTKIITMTIKILCLFFIRNVLVLWKTIKKIFRFWFSCLNNHDGLLLTIFNVANVGNYICMLQGPSNNFFLGNML